MISSSACLGLGWDTLRLVALIKSLSLFNWTNVWTVGIRRKKTIWSEADNPLWWIFNSEKLNFFLSPINFLIWILSSDNNNNDSPIFTTMLQITKLKCCCWSLCHTCLSYNFLISLYKQECLLLFFTNTPSSPGDLLPLDSKRWTLCLYLMEDIN